MEFGDGHPRAGHLLDFAVGPEDDFVDGPLDRGETPGDGEGAGNVPAVIRTPGPDVDEEQIPVF